MVRKIAFGLLWLSVIIYASFFAPEIQPNTFELIKNLCVGKWQGINPLVISLFYIMGVWPLIYSALMFADGRGQKIPAWPFATVSFGVGAFALLPYLSLRQPNPKYLGKKNLFLAILDSRLTGFALTIATVLLVAYGIGTGDWGDFIRQWQTSRFIHVMSLDFCLLCLLFPALLKDDMSRRGLNNSQIFWLSFIPLFGPLIYLCIRPSLPDKDTEVRGQELGISS
ncbi:DUF2834 domain-containing protein [Scytonema sp. NUACC26]|uniref:DUF2834 domain-containing protein n=1 Tax=Scytonema sp. NUACC26 TaxID=3140176 RepID=UPI0034DBD9DC